MQRGFDQFYGTIHGASSFFDPNTLTQGNEYVSRLLTPVTPRTWRMVSFITPMRSPTMLLVLFMIIIKQPTKSLFSLCCFYGSHWPMHAFEKDIAK